MCLGGQNSSCSKFHSNFKFYSFKSRVCLSLSLLEKHFCFSLPLPSPSFSRNPKNSRSPPLCTHKPVQSMGKRSRETD
ncbi:hypothetical protein HanIR_Chr14g0686821 [Helianthus annuus]|nr:hypothetical protein HanIR_Chr14g0686821 [Helianthus annuus]